MVESRWVRWIGPGVIALGAVGLIATASLGAAERPWVPRACGGQPGDRIEAARDGVVAMAALRHEPWFRLDPRLDDAGALAGQRLRVGLGGGRTQRLVDLPAESFVAGPFGRVVLVGSDDGTVSRIEVIDVANGCAWTVGEERDVIRRATIDATGSRLYEARVARATRADLGVWERPLDGRGPAHRILEPLPPDDRFGRTFSTEFTWDLAGDRLAVQACGEVACRTRVVAPGDGSIVALDAPDLGALVGLDRDRLVSYTACRGLPCPIVSTELSSGRRVVIAPDGGPATVVADPLGARVVDEVSDPTGRRLRSVRVEDGAFTDLGPLPDGTTLHPAPMLAGSAMRLPAGWVLLTPDGRMPIDGASRRPLLRRVQDGMTVRLDEVTR